MKDLVVSVYGREGLATIFIGQVTFPKTAQFLKQRGDQDGWYRLTDKSDGNVPGFRVSLRPPCACIGVCKRSDVGWVLSGGRAARACADQATVPALVCQVASLLSRHRVPRCLALTCTPPASRAPRSTSPATSTSTSRSSRSVVARSTGLRALDSLLPYALPMRCPVLT
eukprot:3457757-Rhodomonas_salina.1